MEEFNTDSTQMVRFEISEELKEMLGDAKTVEDEKLLYSTKDYGETYDIFKMNIISKYGENVKCITLMMLDALFTANPILDENKNLILIKNNRTCNVLPIEPDGANFFHHDSGTLTTRRNLVISWGLGTEVINYSDSLLIRNILCIIKERHLFDMYSPFDKFKELIFDTVNNNNLSIDEILDKIKSTSTEKEGDEFQKIKRTRTEKKGDEFQEFQTVVNLAIARIPGGKDSLVIPRSTKNTSPTEDGFIEGIAFSGNIAYHKRMAINLEDSFWRYVLNVQFSPEIFSSKSSGGKKHTTLKKRKRYR